MPFTFSHPAIVLPLAYLPKRWISMTGLVIGSLSPDFEYFIRMKISSVYSHTFAGLFWFDLPLVIILAFIFHNIIRNELIDNLPKFLKSRFETFKDFDWNFYFMKNWFVVIISVLIGAFSHIFWDSFIHDTGYFVEKIPSLSEGINLLGTEIPLLKILQHSSTFIGFFIIAFAIYKLPKSTQVSIQIKFIYWFVLALISMIIVAIRLMTGLSIRHYGNLIVTTISAILISLTLTSLQIKSKSFQNK